MSLTRPTPLDSKMNQDVLSQIYQSFSPAMGTATPALDSHSVFDEWIKNDFVAEYSANSSPEIATPLDQFLSSPPFQAKDDLNSTNMFDLFNMATATNVAPELSSATITSSNDNNLFGDIGDSLPAALAALAAVAAPTNVSPDRISATTPAFSAGPGRSRKRQVPEGVDEAALKRQKNTDAARRSRQRKVQKMESLESRVAELEKNNANLQMRVAVLDSEKTNLKAKESSYESRIKVLEEQLAEAHKALSNRS